VAIFSNQGADKKPKGAGECGKSTILKQMRLIHHGGYPECDREPLRPVVFTNAIQSMQVILEVMGTLGLSLRSNEDKSHAACIMAQPAITDGSALPPDVTQAITVLWRNPSVRACLKRSNEFQLNDSAK